MAENETEKTSTTTDEAIQNVLDDGFATMTNGERSVSNLSIRDLIELKKLQKRENAEESGNVFGRVKIKNNSTRF